MGLFAAVWNLYLGLLSLLGNTLLVIIGIGLCGYATAQQLEPLHNAHLDVALFVAGILLISFSMVRRIVWTFSGLTVVWGALVWFAARALAENDHSFTISTELIALAAAPPLLVTLVLEATRKEQPNETALEITLTEQPENES
jgi:hypothetical protein